jgi:hypothetical protein
MLYDTDKFLTELAKMYERNQTSGTVWLTMKRSARPYTHWVCVYGRGATTFAPRMVRTNRSTDGGDDARDVNGSDHEAHPV